MKRIATVFCGLTLGLLPSQGMSSTCAVPSVAPGDSCKNFSANIDTSSCPGGASTGKPTVSCSGQSATVTVKNPKATYTASFVLRQDRWGAAAWTVAGKVQEASTARETARVITPTPAASPVLLAQNGASAMPPRPAAVETKTESASSRKFYFNYDVSYSHTDNGFDKVDGADAPASTGAMGQTAYLGFKGDVEDVSFEAYVNLMSSGPALINAVEIAKASKSFGSRFTAHAGRNYLNVGGWENKNWIYSTIFVSPYTGAMLPFVDANGGTSATMVQGDINLARMGTLSLQLTDDVVKQTPAAGATTWEYFNTQKRQPALIAEWTATFGPVTPLLQVASYDLNHSMHVAAGAKVDVAGLVAYVDYVSDSRAYKDVADADKEKQVVYTNVSVDLSYATRVVTPFLKFTMFDAKQPDTDMGGNSDKNTFDDNAQYWTVGTNFNTISPYFAPYVAYLSKGAEVLEDPATSLEKAEAKSSATFIVGVGGSIQ